MAHDSDSDVVLLESPRKKVAGTRDMSTNTPIFKDHWVHRPLKVFMSNDNGRDASTQVEHDVIKAPPSGTSTPTVHRIKQEASTSTSTSTTTSFSSMSPAPAYLPTANNASPSSSQPFVQRYASPQQNAKGKKRVMKNRVIYEVVTKNQRVGTENNVPCFYGYDSIVMRGNLNELTSITPAVFDKLLELLGKFKPRTLRTVDHLLMFLIKLRLNLNFNALGAFFDIHPSTIRQNFIKILKILTDKTQHYFSNLPDYQEVIDNLPQASADFNGCRIIVDLLTVKSEIPKDANEDFKFFVGITPNCRISFLSPVFDGTVPHNYIQHSHSLRVQLMPNDSIVTLRQLPWFGWQTIPAKVPDVTQQIRIASENLIGRLKLFKILGQCPLTMMNSASSLVHICAVIMNMVLDEKKEMARQIEIAKRMKVDIDFDHTYSNSYDASNNNDTAKEAKDEELHLDDDEIDEALLAVGL